MGEWSRYARKQQSGGRPVGAMWTRRWEDRIAANHRLDRFVLASTCIHLILEGWQEPRTFVEEPLDYSLRGRC